ncbi:MAG TPA: alpha/beta hydrolase-fold protein [Puia sp.]|nr:alpha/beta hydrolase-fold protein [Puia sp.]
MKKLFYLLMPALALAQMAQAQINAGRTDTLYSKTLGETRRLLIYLPSSYGDTYFYPRRYPVLYLLDGDSHINSVSSMVQMLGERNGPMGFPELIIVAIPNTDRMRDLTPTHITKDPTHMADSATLSRTGGGEKFLAFLGNELMPHIDSLYRTAPYKIFMGHSLGGLTVINAFLHHTSLFNAYVATDPSMSWDNSKLLQQAKDILKEKKFDGKALYLGIADNLVPGADTTTIMSHRTNLFSQHMASIFELRNSILAAWPHATPPPFVPFTAQTPAVEKIPPAGQPPFRFAWKYYPDYDHQSLPIPAEYDALRFVFNYYTLNFPFGEFFSPGWTQDSLIAAHYRTISWYMGYKVAPPEFVINNTGYQLMGNHQLDRAAYYFHLNMDNYPNSFNVYDSMGDLLVARTEKDSAMKCYQKALQLRDNPDTRKKLQDLSR